MCEFEGCSARALYDIPGPEARARWCIEHATGEMKNLKRGVRCACGRTAQYGENRGDTPLWCIECRSENSVLVKGIQCSECPRAARYNLPTEKSPVVCRMHKSKAMLDVVASYGRCTIKDCPKQARFNFPGDKASFCKLHKQPGMRDVITRRCRTEGCEVLPSYGVPGGLILHCQEHHEPGEEYLATGKCEFCPKQPSLGFPGGRATRCADHREEGMLSVYSKPVVGSDKYKRVKENYFRQWAADSLVDIPHTINQRIPGGTSRKIPDIFIDRISHVIIVELDEHQHVNYPIEKELRRINELSGDVRGRPIVFLRINPDDFVDAKGVRREGCFRVDKRNGKLKPINARWSRRLEWLKGRILHWLNEIPPRTLEELLFYDHGRSIIPPDFFCLPEAPKGVENPNEPEAPNEPKEPNEPEEWKVVKTTTNVTTKTTENTRITTKVTKIWEERRGRPV